MSLNRSSAYLAAKFAGEPIPAPRSKIKRVARGAVTLGSSDDTLSAISRSDRDTKTREFNPSQPFPNTVACPCCRRPIEAPTLEMVIDHCQLSPMQARVLTAVWKAKGFPVMPARVFDVMYADDPNGGPGERDMYRAFKVALCYLRKRLKGSGVAIESVGYGRGYRLIMEGK